MQQGIVLAAVGGVLVAEAGKQEVEGMVVYFDIEQSVGTGVFLVVAVA